MKNILNQSLMTYGYKFIFAVFLSISSLLVYSTGLAKTVQINIRNYTDVPLTYIENVTTFNSNIMLPTPKIVPAGTPANGGTANLYVSNGNEDYKEARGAFAVGYDRQHYCVFTYKMTKVLNHWSWYMQSSDFVGMGKVSCSVDPDSHTVIVFQTIAAAHE